MNGKIIIIQTLVDSFASDEKRYISSHSSYQETEARIEFIDPFFEVLGWDMSNRQRLSFSKRDVLREETQISETSSKKPDYSFRIATKRLFFVEAKRPSVDIRTNKESAFQARSYGFTANHKIVVLTNFRTIRIYNSSVEPKATDDADVALIRSIDYKNYVSELPYLIDQLGRESVSLGSIERLHGHKSHGASPSGRSFLERINKWRISLASDLLSRYADLDAIYLSDITQKLINRIIFIRMCEDRGIEGEERLRKVARKKDILELRLFFRAMDKRYNTGLFDASKDGLSSKYYIDPAVFLGIVDEIYAPNSPYSFGVLDAEFLGQVYDLFLSNRLTVNSYGIVSLEPKPAYEGREVVTTPQDIVHNLVKDVFNSKLAELGVAGELCQDTIMSLRVLDVATGSGRFIIKSFDELVEATINTIIESGNTDILYKVSDGDYRLPFEMKKEILQNCLYGVDIDYNAVEIARFGLLIKLLEDETGDTLPTCEKILPNLDSNIIHGNTVVSLDKACLDLGLDKLTPSINWEGTTFPKYFDIIVGNPPYVKTEDMKNDCEAEFKYLKKRYVNSAFRQFDKYFVFVEFAISRLKDRGRIGMLIPNKWMTIESGKKIRAFLNKDVCISKIIDFGNEQIFGGKSTYVCMLFAAKQKLDKLDYRAIKKYSEYISTPEAAGNLIPQLVLNKMGGDSWVLPSSQKEAATLTGIFVNSTRLSAICDIANGIQTSADKIYILNKYEMAGDKVVFTDVTGDKVSIEKSITRPYVSDSLGVVSYERVIADALVVFPYKLNDKNIPCIITPDILADDYPCASAYFDKHKARLLKRDISPEPKDGCFYAFGRHQALDVVFTAPKIIYSVNQRGDKYGIDYDGIAYSSGGTAGEVAILNPRQGYSLEFILALLNQRPIELFSRKRGSAFEGGWYARGSAVVSDIPVPQVDFSSQNHMRDSHDKISVLMLNLTSVSVGIKSATGRNYEKLLSQKSALVRQISDEFNLMWDFTATQVKEISMPGEL
jgi:hypothetical protein